MTKFLVIMLCILLQALLPSWGATGIPAYPADTLFSGFPIPDLNIFTTLGDLGGTFMLAFTAGEENPTFYLYIALFLYFFLFLTLPRVQRADDMEYF